MTQGNKSVKNTRDSSRANYLSNPAEQFGQKQNNLSRLWVVIIVLVLVAAGGFVYQKNHKSTPTKPTISQVVNDVSKHIVLPSGEQPTLATVSDVQKVKTQAFFARAANGDQVLIYAKAKKAFLYRPSIDRLLEVAPLTSGTTTKQ